jgi:hypothetical protein
MTADQIATMEAGPECDRLVAEAIGWTLDEEYAPETNGPGLFWRDADGKETQWRAHEFKPSTDWNHAMFAAERFGLFGEPHRFGLWKSGGNWCVGMDEYPLEPGNTEAPSGPLAICCAILKLSQSVSHPS